MGFTISREQMDGRTYRYVNNDMSALCGEIVSHEPGGWLGWSYPLERVRNGRIFDTQVTAAYFVVHGYPLSGEPR